MTVQTILKHSFRIAQKDLTELFRNRLGLVLLIVMPLFMMVMVGFIYPSNGTISDLQVGVVNEDSGFHGTFAPSQGFLIGLNQINDQTHMLIMTNLSSTADLTDQVQRGVLEGGIVIPANFSQSIMSGQQGTIIIVSDQSNPQISATIQGALKGVFSAMSTQLAINNVKPLNATNSLAVVQPYTITTQGVVSGNPSYFDFIAPGIMAMTVMMSVMTGLPVAISQEKEIGTMDGMMVAPVNRLSILLGKTIAQTMRGLIQGVIILALAIGIFGVAIQGSILLVFALLLLGVFSFVGLGIVVTSFTKDQETAQMLMMTLMFPMMFLGGVFFPIQQMPWYMQDIAKVLPLTYASDALRKVMVLGAGIPQITDDLIILIVFGVVMIAIALPVFKRMMTR
jgi:ABC-2 type transport system permease protein